MTPAASCEARAGVVWGSCPPTCLPAGRLSGGLVFLRFGPELTAEGVANGKENQVCGFYPPRRVNS
jgi:hypothetical protein